MRQAAANELERMNPVEGTFHSPYEAYAVMKEKYEGAKEKLHQTKLFISDFWENVKEDNIAYFAEALMHTKENALECAAEVIRTALIAQKTLDCIEKANAPGAA